MKIAIVHDWIVTYAGAERILEQLLLIWPDADLYSLVDFLPEEKRDFIQHKKVRTSFIQNLPFAKKAFRHYFPLFPLAIQQFDFSSYDVVISNSYSVAKGVITGPDTLHISICCSPIRYAWDLQNEYLEQSNISGGLKGLVARLMLHRVRLWDAAMGGLPNHIAAISHFVARRVRKFYNRDADVIYPPVDVEAFELCESKDDFYLAASRQVPYKHIGTIVAAFKSMPNKTLVVIGTGPEADHIASIAGNAPNIQLMGYQPFSVLRNHMQRAKAFLFAAQEDFGIVPLEALACGTPVIAFGGGGATETICGREDDPNPSGLFFYEQTPESIAEAVNKFESCADKFVPAQCRSSVMHFANGKYRETIKDYVHEKMEEHKAQLDSAMARSDREKTLRPQ